MTTSEAPGQLGNEARTLPLAASMMVAAFPRRLATTRVLPSGVRRAATGWSPAAICAISRRAVRSMTETELETELAM